jgi:hypothetical protein
MRRPQLELATFLYVAGTYVADGALILGLHRRVAKQLLTGCIFTPAGKLMQFLASSGMLTLIKQYIIDQIEVCLRPVEAACS